MQKVELPKNLWISSAEVGFFREGLYNGIYGLTLHFSGTDSAGSTDIMAEILQPLTKVPLPKRRIVRFEGLFSPTDKTITLAVRAFQSWGFKVHAIVDSSQADLPWLPSVDWLVLKTSSTWVPVVSHELWYCPVACEGDIPEPEVPAPTKTVLYLSKGYSVAQTSRFVLASRNNWSLL